MAKKSVSGRKNERNDKDYYAGQLRLAMEGLGRYDENYGPAIRQLASAMEQYDRAVEAIGEDLVVETESREGDRRLLLNPAFQAVNILGEQIRKWMRDLGLVVAKPAGYTGQEKDRSGAKVDAFATMLSDMAHPKVRLYKRSAKA